VTFVHAEKIGFGPEARTAAIAQAKLAIRSFADAPLQAAA